MHPCDPSSIRSQLLLSVQDGRSWFMHVLQADDEDALVTVFCCPSGADESTLSAFLDRFVAGLSSSVHDHPGASVCRSCRLEDPGAWKQDFGDLVTSAYRPLRDIALPVDDEDVPDAVRCEFDVILRA